MERAQKKKKPNPRASQRPAGADLPATAADANLTTRNATNAVNAIRVVDAIATDVAALKTLMQTAANPTRSSRTVVITRAMLKTNANPKATVISLPRLKPTLTLKRSTPTQIPMRPSKVHVRLAVVAVDVVLVAASHKAPMKTTLRKTTRTSKIKAIKPRPTKVPIAVTKAATKNARRSHREMTLADHLRTTRKAISLQKLQATTLSAATTQVTVLSARIRIPATPATVNVSRDADAVLRMDNSPHLRTSRPISPLTVLQSLQAQTAQARNLKTVQRTRLAVNPLLERHTPCGRRKVQALLAQDRDVTINAH